MNYNELHTALLGALAENPLLHHVAGHTQPASTLANYNGEGLPAAIVRLLGVNWTPVPETEHTYRGVARVEITLRADPARTAYGDWLNLLTQARAAGINFHGSAYLVSEASYPAPEWEYRIVFGYKLEQVVEV